MRSQFAQAGLLLLGDGLTAQHAFDEAQQIGHVLRPAQQPLAHEVRLGASIEDGQVLVEVDLERALGSPSTDSDVIGTLLDLADVVREEVAEALP